MEINRKAPVNAEGKIEIGADAETVWKVLAAIDSWPSWNPDVKSVSLAGSLAKGTTFRWKAGPGRIVSVIQNVKRERLLAWTGRTLGIRAIHVWRLEPGGGGTFVTTEESWEGLIVRLFRRAMQKSLERAISSGLMHLKAEAERRVRPRG